MNPTADFIRCFVEKSRQSRYLALSANPKRRSEFIWALAHDGRHLEYTRMERLSGESASLTAVAERLKSLGASETCFVIAAAHLEPNNGEMSTFEALAAVVGKSEDTLLFFTQSSLAYYENHEGEQFILHVKAL